MMYIAHPYFFIFFEDYKYDFQFFKYKELPIDQLPFVCTRQTIQSDITTYMNINLA
jgi:hypothetical protein